MAETLSRRRLWVQRRARGVRLIRRALHPATSDKHRAIVPFLICSALITVCSYTTSTESHLGNSRLHKSSITELPSLVSHNRWRQGDSSVRLKELSVTRRWLICAIVNQNMYTHLQVVESVTWRSLPAPPPPSRAAAVTPHSINFLHYVTHAPQTSNCANKTC